MEIVIEILTASWQVFREAAMYILLGLGVAGLMRVYITPDSVGHYFRRGRFKSVVYAALLGIPIPL
jgi:uncharacterized membrane protein YraQ (UPF0718 family)